MTIPQSKLQDSILIPNCIKENYFPVVNNMVVKGIVTQNRSRSLIIVSVLYVRGGLNLFLYLLKSTVVYRSYIVSVSKFEVMPGRSLKFPANILKKKKKRNYLPNLICKLNLYFLIYNVLLSRFYLKNHKLGTKWIIINVYHSGVFHKVNHFIKDLREQSGLFQIKPIYWLTSPELGPMSFSQSSLLKHSLWCIFSFFSI